MSAADPASKPEDASKTETATIAMLKAWANPVRRRVNDALARRGFARAADLAEDLGLPANQLSFHLRVLADAGLVEEAPERARDKRDRVWKQTTRSFNLGSPDDPATDARLTGAVMQGLLSDHSELVRRAAIWGEAYSRGENPDLHGVFSMFRLWLTREEFGELTRTIMDAIHAASSLHQAGDEGVQHWDVHLIAADDQI
ncbi:MAG: helix-turn-helix domain-containing protein [Microbacterium sp.]